MFSISSFIFLVRHSASRLLHAYADWRIGATEAEKRCYKPTDSILLTFDDYGTDEEVRGILQILEEMRVRAMFFPTGTWATEHPELIGQIRSAGHIVGNHTATHAILSPLNKIAIEHEITAGVASTWLRPPQGRYNRRVRAIANRLGYAICYWAIDSRDWTSASPAEMMRTIFSELRPGAAILFHIHGTYTSEALPGIIDGIRSRGYNLTSWDEPAWQP